MNCKHYAWDVDEEGTLYCTYCDEDLSEKERYKKNSSQGKETNEQSTRE